MSAPKISIIVPVYKVEKYLRRCLDSIVAQTFTDWECILIDDGSPDNSGKICDEYVAKDGRFRVIHQENQGVSAARNAGLDAAKGEWIGFVDSDDWIEPNMYEYLYNDALETRSDAVICGFVGQHKKRIQKMCGTEESVKLLFDQKGFGGFSVLRLIAAEKVKNIRFDTTVSYMEDNQFFYYAFKKCEKIYWDNKPLYHYEERIDSVTHLSGFTKQAESAIQMLDRLYEEEQIKSLKKIILNHKLLFCIYFASPYITKNKTLDEKYLFLKQIIRNRFVNIIFASNITFRSKCIALAISYSPLTILLQQYRKNKKL